MRPPRCCFLDFGWSASSPLLLVGTVYGTAYSWSWDGTLYGLELFLKALRLLRAATSRKKLYQRKSVYRISLPHAEALCTLSVCGCDRASSLEAEPLCAPPVCECVYLIRPLAKLALQVYTRGSRHRCSWLPLFSLSTPKPHETVIWPSSPSHPHSLHIQVF